MARPKSNDKRTAIMEAAARVIVAQGLSAPTATIAKEAGVSNGSLFTYFETKADLFNQLYLEIKASMAGAAMEKFPAGTDLRKQASHIWTHWMEWATQNPVKRHALAQLALYDQITPQSQAAAGQIMAGILDVMERLRVQGPFRNSPLPFFGSILNSIADATMDYMIKDPTHAKKHCKVGFEAFWRVLN